MTQATLSYHRDSLRSSTPNSDVARGNNDPYRGVRPRQLRGWRLLGALPTRCPSVRRRHGSWSQVSACVAPPTVMLCRRRRLPVDCVCVPPRPFAPLRTTSRGLGHDHGRRRFCGVGPAAVGRRTNATSSRVMMSGRRSVPRHTATAARGLRVWRCTRSFAPLRMTSRGLGACADVVRSAAAVWPSSGHNLTPPQQPPSHVTTRPAGSRRFALNRPPRPNLAWSCTRRSRGGRPGGTTPSPRPIGRLDATTGPT